MNPTQTVLTIFEELSAIPRKSGNEQFISEWLQKRAAQHGFTSQTDAAGNLVIRVPGSAGYENAPTVILQGHMDMVCEKNADVAHDFMKDPIPVVVDGDQLKITKTANADTPIAHGVKPLLTLDVWEHAYYLDYQNRRPDYLGAVITKLIDWDFVNANLG